MNILKKAVKIIFVFILTMFIVIIIIVIIANFDRYEENKYDAERIALQLLYELDEFYKMNNYYTKDIDSLSTISNLVKPEDMLFLSEKIVSFKHKGRIYTEVPMFDKNSKRTLGAYTYYEDEDEMLERKIDELVEASQNGIDSNYTTILNKVILGKGVKVIKFDQNEIELKFEGIEVKRHFKSY